MGGEMADPLVCLFTQEQGARDSILLSLAPSAL